MVAADPARMTTTMAAFVALSLALLTGSTVEAQTWSSETCRAPDAKVTFSKCCGEEKFCSPNKDQTSCLSGENQLYCQWSETNMKCQPRPDDRSDVCCRGGKVGDACHSLAYKMECPKDWLVKSECCPDPEARKYSVLLGGGAPGMVCCNTPCTQMAKANCTLDARCAPGKRSMAMTVNPYQNLGFYFQRPLGMAPKSFGHVMSGTGLAFDDGFLANYFALTGSMMPYGYPPSVVSTTPTPTSTTPTYTTPTYGGSGTTPGFGAYGSSKAKHVDEITVDDLFELLIDALRDDTNVKSYSGQIESDPLFGKVKTGGFKANLNLPDANFFLDKIYGSPYGMSPPMMPAPGGASRMGQSLRGIYSGLGTSSYRYPVYGGMDSMFGGGGVPSSGGMTSFYGGGGTTPPYGGMTSPYKGMTSPYGGYTTLPYGGMTSPYGGTTPPYGGTTPPYGGTTPPYGGTTPPYGGTTPLYGGTTPLYGGTTPPYGGTTPPYGGTSPPYGDTTPPYGGTSPPYGGTTPPYGGTTPPYGGTSPTYGSPVPGYGGGSGSYGGGTTNPYGGGTPNYGGGSTSSYGSVTPVYGAGTFAFGS